MNRNDIIYSALNIYLDYCELEDVEKVKALIEEYTNGGRKEIIRKALENYVDHNYGEAPDEACYDLASMAEDIDSALG